MVSRIKLMIFGIFLRGVKYIGDPGIGKTTLLASYVTGSWHDTFLPTIGQPYLGTILLGIDRVDIEIIDTAGVETFQELCQGRLHVDIIFICYSCVRLSSFDSLDEGTSDLNTLDNPVPVYLVATKRDLFEAENPLHLSS